MWGAATAQKRYQKFLPPDTTFTHDSAANPGVNGVYLVYMSMRLANTLPVQVFVDSAGKQLTPGTFDVVRDSKITRGDRDASGGGLAVGEWPGR